MYMSPFCAIWFFVTRSRSVKDLCRKVVTSAAFYSSFESTLLSMKASNSSKIRSIELISSRLP
jgi:hypothetical protein